VIARWVRAERSGGETATRARESVRNKRRGKRERERERERERKGEMREAGSERKKED